jgi:hypothetical protein
MGYGRPVSAARWRGRASREPRPRHRPGGRRLAGGDGLGVVAGVGGAPPPPAPAVLGQPPGSPPGAALYALRGQGAYDARAYPPAAGRAAGAGAGKEGRVRETRRGLLAALLLTLALAAPTWGACPPVKRSAAVVRVFKRTHICPTTQRIDPHCPAIVDHIVPLCLGQAAGGIDAVSNMQYQDRASARAKDRIEKQMCRVVGCQHRGD